MACIIAGILTGTPTLAQTGEAIEELVIVGAREPVAAAEFGASFSILDRDALEARQVPLLSEILRDLPGLAVSRTGPVGSQSQIRIRGAEGNQTMVLIDGIEATDPVGNFEFDFADLVTTGIERVEVIRGPQSALYGSEAIGGVINILTREPRQGYGLEALGEGGSFSSVRVGATAMAGTERYGAAVSVGYHETGGVSASPTGPEDDGYDNLTLSGKLTAELASGLTVGAVGRYVDATSEFDAQDFVTGRVVDSDMERRFKAFYGRTYARLDLFDAAWTQTVALDLTDTDTDNLTDGAFLNSFEGERLKAQYQSTVTLGETALTAAIEHEELDFRAEGMTPEDPLNQTASDDQTSLVGEWRTGLTDRLFFTVGLRHDFNDTFADETTWRTTLSYRILSATRLHGSFGTGVSDPTFFDRFGFFPDFFVGNPALTPEFARGWDIGVAQRLWSGRIEIDVTYFASELEDEVVPSFDPVTFLSSVENQRGKSERRGVEVTARLRPFEALLIDAAYTYLDADEPDGSREIRRAKHIASLTATYRSAGNRAEISLDFDYNGAQDDLDFSTFPATRVRLDDFLLVTLATRYRLFDGIAAVARVENLLDEDYQNVFGFNTPGIGAFAGLEARF